MAVHEYTPQQAFEVLMTHLRDRDNRLATHIQAAVDAGQDVDETEQVGRRGRKKSRSYRRTVPYSYAEALQVALDALQAYFIEQPLFADSCAKNMEATEVGSLRLVREPWFAPDEHLREAALETLNKPKRIEIELGTETQISKPNDEMFELREIDVEQITEQRNNLGRLRNLVAFEANNGNS